MARWRYTTDDEYRQRLKERVKVDANGCWIYQGWTNPHTGYAEMCYRNDSWRAHRLSFFLFKGEIPAGHDVCHSCDVRNCINPEHLWSGPRILNNRDTRDKGRDNNSQKTHCPKGHAYAEHGAKLKAGYKGWRECRRCNLIKNRLKLGWTREQAETLPVTPKGGRPVNRNRSSHV